MITKIEILQQQELGYVAPLAWKKKSISSTVTIVPPVCERKDVIARAVRYAKHIITSSNYFISETSADPIYELARNYEPSEGEIF